MRSQSYKDLIVWQKGIELSVLVYEVCSGLPKSELYGLADQMKRAAVSVSSNIAEGQARQHPREIIQFLSVSDGSLAELDTQRIIAERSGFLSRQSSIELDQRITGLRKMIYSLKAKLKTKN